MNISSIIIHLEMQECSHFTELAKGWGGFDLLEMLKS